MIRKSHIQTRRCHNGDTIVLFSAGSVPSRTARIVPRTFWTSRTEPLRGMVMISLRPTNDERRVRLSSPEHPKRNSEIAAEAP